MKNAERLTLNAERKRHENEAVERDQPARMSETGLKR